MDRRLNLGMVGGGPGAFIGAVHRIAAGIDGKMQLVCGAFSSSPEKSQQTGRELFLPSGRVYGSYLEMFEKEAALPEGERMDIVSIVTPNHMHFPVTMAALENGFHVICDKPVTMSLDEAVKLRDKISETGLEFCLTHTYTGYPMVKHAHELVENGEIGDIVKVVSEYPQGWLMKRLELEEGQKQAAWRTDPKMAGISCCMGDLGCHAENLAEYITGLHITDICADLTSYMPGRQLDDDGNVLVRFSNGAKGIIYASQISVGEENNLNIRVYGTKGGLEWHQQDPNTLIVKHIDRPTEIVRTNYIGLGEAAAYNTRFPAGHPEGYVEAFANHYKNFAEVVAARMEGREPDVYATDYPGIEDGIRGMAFIEGCVASSKSAEKWYKLPQP